MIIAKFQKYVASPSVPQVSQNIFFKDTILGGQAFRSIFISLAENFTWVIWFWWIRLGRALGGIPSSFGR